MVKRGYKKSKQRDKLLEVLQATNIHPTANWLYDSLKPELPKLSMGTVYRNLNVLLDQNLIQRIEAGSSFDRYDANTENHYHFFCRKCESVDDLHVNIKMDLDKNISLPTGYLVEDHRLDYYGLCPDCSSEDQKQA